MKAKYLIELSAREFELLAGAYDYWHSMVAPQRMRNETVQEIDTLLKEFRDEYEKRPF